MGICENSRNLQDKLCRPIGFISLALNVLISKLVFFLYKNEQKMNMCVCVLMCEYVYIKYVCVGILYLEEVLCVNIYVLSRLLQVGLVLSGNWIQLSVR